MQHMCFHRFRLSRFFLALLKLDLMPSKTLRMILGTLPRTTSTRPKFFCRTADLLKHRHLLLCPLLYFHLTFLRTRKPNNNKSMKLPTMIVLQKHLLHSTQCLTRGRQKARSSPFWLVAQVPFFTTTSLQTNLATTPTRVPAALPSIPHLLPSVWSVHPKSLTWPPTHNQPPRLATILPPSPLPRLLASSAGLATIFRYLVPLRLLAITVTMILPWLHWWRLILSHLNLKTLLTASTAKTSLLPKMLLKVLLTAFLNTAITAPEAINSTAVMHFFLRSLATSRSTMTSAACVQSLDSMTHRCRNL